MFNLMKKDKDKDGGRKEKKEKKEKKERMSAAELRSLEEMSLRRGFFNLNRSSKRDSRTRLEISNPIPIKYVMGRLGYGTGDPRLPLTPLSDAGRAVVDPVLRSLALIE